ncbi:MAG: type II toxin-antitoxin system RatA family toxin [Gemmatimonadaceae bacterium]
MIGGAPPAGSLGAMPLGRAMETTDERLVAAPPASMFDVARDVESWPAHLAHYRFVRIRERSRAGFAVVEMSAYRQFGPIGWPTWWLSLMEIVPGRPAIRFRHIEGITKEMDVEWSFEQAAGGTRVRIVHAWDGPRWPVIGVPAARLVIGPVFIHGIASRTLAGLARVAERDAAGRVEHG